MVPAASDVFRNFRCTILLAIRLTLRWLSISMGRVPLSALTHTMGGFLHGDHLHDLIRVVEKAGKDLATQPERWLVWTSLLSSLGQDVRFEHHAIKKDVEMTLQTLDEMARRALENDQALLFMGD